MLVCKEVIVTLFDKEKGYGNGFIVGSSETVFIRQKDKSIASRCCNDVYLVGNIKSCQANSKTNDQSELRLYEGLEIICYLEPSLKRSKWIAMMWAPLSDVLSIKEEIEREPSPRFRVLVHVEAQNQVKMPFDDAVLWEGDNVIDLAARHPISSERIRGRIVHFDALGGYYRRGVNVRYRFEVFDPVKGVWVCCKDPRKVDEMRKIQSFRDQYVRVDCEHLSEKIRG